MRLVFMGTPEFAVPSLRALAACHEVELVLTRPDAVRGRGRKLAPSAVKAAALELGIPVLETTRISDEVFSQLEACEPELIAVAAFGSILPDRVLELAPFGCVNVHASLLPRWRGAAPIQRAILAGDAELGVSIMRVVHELDAGPYCRQASLAAGELGCQELMEGLAELGAHELLEALKDIEADSVVWAEQDESQASYAAKLEKHEMLLKPDEGSEKNLRRVRASLDAAPARAIVGGRGLRVCKAQAAKTLPAELLPGQFLRQKSRVFLGCASGALELLVVKPDGKREMAVSAWASGLQEAHGSWTCPQ